MNTSHSHRLRHALPAISAAAGAIASSLTTTAISTVFVAAAAGGYSAPAQAWWACPTDYEEVFLTRNGNTNVRCRQPVQTINAPCPPTNPFRVINESARDRCYVTQGSIGGAYLHTGLCPPTHPNFDERPQGQIDRCSSNTQYAAPNRNVP
jgi:hypothetical protein